MPEVLNWINKICGKLVRHVDGLRVAALYVVLGAIGLVLAIPPGYATPVFPAAGLALAAILCHGRKVLPYVGLGSFILNLGHAVHSGDLTLNSAIAAGGIAGGAMLQAAWGHWWVIRRLGNAWQRLESEAQMITLLVRGGVQACFVSATVAVAVLWSLQMIALEAIPFSWWTWYTGDLLGVAIFSPIA